mgnify:CR=1 FL=1
MSQEETPSAYRERVYEAFADRSQPFAAAVESALTYVSEGYFGERPETVHRKAAHLMRLLVADHPYVDGNKRTALAAAAYLYDLNGYELHATDDLRGFLRSFATDAETVDMDSVVDYLRAQTTKKH